MLIEHGWNCTRQLLHTLPLIALAVFLLTLLRNCITSGRLLQRGLLLLGLGA